MHVTFDYKKKNVMLSYMYADKLNQFKYKQNSET